MAFSGPEPYSGKGEFSRCLEAAAGSPEALGSLLEMCRPYLLGVGNQQLEMDLQAKAGASDLVQETFLEAQRDFRGFHGGNEAELLAWLRQILLNNFANLRRHYRDTDKRDLQARSGPGQLGRRRDQRSGRRRFPQQSGPGARTR